MVLYKSLELKGEFNARDINFSVIGLCMVFKDIRPEAMKLGRLFK